MADAVETMANIIPVALMGGIAMNMTDRIFGQRDNTSPQKAGKNYSPLTTIEITQLLGKNKVDILKKHAETPYKFGGDTYIFHQGEYYLAD